VTDKLARFISDKAGILAKAGIDQAKKEIELILCHLLEIDRLHLYLDGSALLTDTVITRLDGIIKRRATRYPLQYILEEAWFYGRKFYVSPAVMVPAPETEVLCEAAIDCVREKKVGKPRILDLGVGSGVIAVTLARELDDCSIMAVDISQEAIQVARRNADKLGAADKIEFRRSDFFSSVADNEQFDLILSNPPYVSEKEYQALPPEVLADPKSALLAGEDGLDAIRVILRQAPDYLAKSGRIIFEIGYNQGTAVADLTESDKRYQSIVIIKDLNDIDRVVVLSCKR
jgi:release factor glutamine methyltransferase